MKRFSDHINRYRVRKGMFASDDSYGMVGAWFIPLSSTVTAKILSGDGMGWEHVSVSLPDRTPTWEEMCQIKDLFWNDNEAVIQLHPKKKDYVNQCGNCLHLWRPIRENIPLPPAILVGIK